jgi:uncharacterized membrane protein YdjX (TVP38/TMEM64 family)
VDQRREEPAAPSRAGFWPRVGIVAGVLALVVAFYALGYHRYLTWDAIQTNLHQWREDAQRHLPLSLLLFFLAYVATTALSLPVSFFLSLLGGALFDFWLGTAVCSLGSTGGAVLSFLNSRYVLRDWVRRRFGHRLGRIDRGVQRDGAWFLFSLRLAPVIPFFLINLGMGLTPMRLGTYTFVSWLGMLPIKAILVEAGSMVGSMEGPSEIMSPGTLVMLTLLGLAPLGLRVLVRALRRRMAKPSNT